MMDSPISHGWWLAFHGPKGVCCWRQVSLSNLCDPAIMQSFEGPIIIADVQTCVCYRCWVAGLKLQVRLTAPLANYAATCA